jgi:hypothetical protein
MFTFFILLVPNVTLVNPFLFLTEITPLVSTGVEEPSDSPPPLGKP